MIKKNNSIKTTILNYGCNAEGVAKIDNQVVFLPFTLVDEEITATIINDKNKFLIGKPNKIENQNPNRVLAPCPYFTKCGGCQLQHCNYQHALNIKQQIVQDAITNIGKIDFKVLPCKASDLTYNYRNKVALPINPKTKKLGMYRTGTHNIVDIEQCLLQKQQINKLIGVFNNYLQTTKTSIYDSTTNRGVLKHLVAREIGNQLLITVVINSKTLNDQQYLVDLLKQNFNNFGLSVNINTLNNNVILSNHFIHIYGLTEIELCENEICYQINNQSFFQVNDNIKNEIYKQVFEQIKDETVIDAYSGAGLLSAMLCKHAKQVYGIEIIEQATKSADLLKQKNNITNLTNINGDCTKQLPLLLDQLTKNQKQSLSIVLDPPRKGCTKQVLQSILQAKPQKIIYISCNPSTLARDLNILISDNLYKIQKIQPFDMFPQTKHVETLAILTKY